MFETYSINKIEKFNNLVKSFIFLNIETTLDRNYVTQLHFTKFKFVKRYVSL